MAKEAPWEVLAYSFRVDPSSPTLLKKNIKIFKVDPEEVNLSPNHQVDGWSEYADCEQKVAETYAMSLGIGGSYMAFSGSANMSASHETKSNIKTARLDVYIKATNYTAQARPRLNLKPETFLDEVVVEFIQQKTPQEIIDTIGEFYATSCELGGLFKKSYVMELQETDTSSSVMAELKTSYGPDLVGQVSATTKMEYGSRKSNKEAKQKTMWQCDGGNVNVWLGCSGDTTKTQNDWAQTINDDNLFCYNLKMVPMFELCKKVDPAKGDKVQMYCTEKWARNGFNNPSQFVKNEVVARMVRKSAMSKAGSDAGSGANKDIEYWAHNSGDWLMLGHSFYGEEMMVVQPGPLVKKATGWLRIWNDQGSGNSRDYDIYVPQCGADFLPLGVVFVFGSEEHAQPPPNSPFACVHKSVCEPVSLGNFCWSDAGTGASKDVSLDKIPRMGTMWPSKADLLHPGQAHAIKSSCLSQ